MGEEKRWKEEESRVEEEGQADGCKDHVAWVENWWMVEQMSELESKWVDVEQRKSCVNR